MELLLGQEGKRTQEVHHCAHSNHLALFTVEPLL